MEEIQRDGFCHYERQSVKEKERGENEDAADVGENGGENVAVLLFRLTSVYFQ